MGNQASGSTYSQDVTFFKYNSGVNRLELLKTYGKNVCDMKAEWGYGRRLAVSRQHFDILHAAEQVRVEEEEEETETDRRLVWQLGDEETWEEAKSYEEQVELPAATMARRAAPRLKVYRVPAESALVPYKITRPLDVLSRMKYETDRLNRIMISKPAVQRARRRFKRSLPMLKSAVKYDFCRRIIAFLQYIQYYTTVNKQVAEPGIEPSCMTVVRHALNWAASYWLDQIQFNCRRLFTLLAAKDSRLPSFLSGAFVLVYPAYLADRRAVLERVERLETQAVAAQPSRALVTRTTNARYLTVNIQQPLLQPPENNLIRRTYAVTVCLMHSQYPIKVEQSGNDLFVTANTFQVPPNFTLIRFPMALFSSNYTQKYAREDLKVTAAVDAYLQQVTHGLDWSTYTHTYAEQPQLLIHMLEKVAAELKKAAVDVVNKDKQTRKEERNALQEQLRQYEAKLEAHLHKVAALRHARMPEEHYEQLREKYVSEGYNRDEADEKVELDRHFDMIVQASHLEWQQPMLAEETEELLNIVQDVVKKLQANLDRRSDARRYLNMLTTKPVVNIFLPGEVVTNKLYATSLIQDSSWSVKENAQKVLFLNEPSFVDCTYNGSLLLGPAPDDMLDVPAARYRGPYLDTYCETTGGGQMLLLARTSLERIVKYYADSGFHTLYMLDFSCSGMDDVDLREGESTYASLFTEAGLAGGAL